MGNNYPNKAKCKKNIECQAKRGYEKKVVESYSEMILAIPKE